LNLTTFSVRPFIAAKSNAPSIVTKRRVLTAGSPTMIELDDQNACLPSVVFGVTR
jgi:hypothetical protein